jgi:Flp pilus assembly pilin Flp
MAKKKKVFEKGQGIVEYILITALVSLAAITIFKMFREDVHTAYQKAGQALVQGVTDSVATDGTNGE